MAMVTIDNAAATIAAAEKPQDVEKPQDAEKPDYAPYNGASTAADGGTGAGVRGGGGGGRVVDSVVARWRREDMLDKSPLALHGAAAVFALVALVLVASNQHGGWMQFDRYEEYRCASGRRLLAGSGTACSSIRVYLWLIIVYPLSP
jgi:hypothetical protein